MKHVNDLMRGITQTCLQIKKDILTAEKICQHRPSMYQMNVFEPADYIQLINTSNKVKREMSSFSINGNDSKKTCLSSDEDLKKKKNKKKKKIK
jgi:hypothetical protein